MSIEAILLGAAQDGGVPQAGCYCRTCSHARETAGVRPGVCSLGLLDRGQRAFWLVDATPDFPAQLHLLQTAAPDCALRGIFITHAHIGHYTGLVHLGREAMNSRRLPIYGTEPFGAFLKAHAPWKQLDEIGNIVWQPVQPDSPLALTADLAVTPISVPHRGEYSDTVGYLVRGPQRSLFYCPDIDNWSHCAFDVRAFLGTVDVALVDGTFFDQGELPGREMREVPHPLVRESVALLAGLPTEIRFIHLNHTNPLWHDGVERAWLDERGFAVGQPGQRWVL